MPEQTHEAGAEQDAENVAYPPMWRRRGHDDGVSMCLGQQTTVMFWWRRYGGEAGVESDGPMEGKIKKRAVNNKGFEMGHAMID